MATAKKKAPAKRATAAPKKSAAKKSRVRKTAAKKPVKGNVFRNAINEALDQMDQWVDTARLKAKQLAAEEKLMEKKAELAVRTELDKAKHLADQAEKWTRARIKSDTRKINALEKKLSRQLHHAERKLVAQARAAEKKANKQGRALKKRLESETKRAFGKAPAKKKVAALKKKAAASKKKAAAPKRKAAATKAKPRAKKK
jgi:histone H1/5